MEDRIETIIRDYLNKEFKNPDAIPGLLIKGIAKEINDHRYEIHSYVKDEYDEDSIDMVAEDKGIELTKAEKEYALKRYRKAQDYDDNSGEYLDEIMNEIMILRGEEK